MSALLLDTQAVVWMLFSPDKLSETARQAIDAANQKGETLYVSALSLVELTFLMEKGRLPQIVLDTLTDELTNKVISSLPLLMLLLRKRSSSFHVAKFLNCLIG